MIFLSFLSFYRSFSSVELVFSCSTDSVESSVDVVVIVCALDDSVDFFSDGVAGLFEEVLLPDD